MKFKLQIICYYAMRRIVYIGFSLLILLSSCRSSDSFLDMFPVTLKLTPQSVTMETDSISKPIMMEYSKGKLYFCNIFTSPLIDVFDWETGHYMGSFGNRGVGADEFIGFDSMNRYSDNGLFLFDNNKKEGVVWCTDSLAGKNKRITIENTENVFPFKVVGLDNDLFLSTGIVKGGRFALYNGTGNLVSVFGQYSYDEEHIYTDREVECAFAYQSEMAYNKINKVLAVANRYGESISFYNLGNLSDIQLMEEYLSSHPQYENASTENSSSVVFERDNIVGFVDMASTSDYCIGLYLGETRLRGEKWKGGNILLLFDWKGKPLCKIVMPRKYEMMTSSEDEIILFGTDNEKSEYVIDKINISDIKY